MPCRICGKSSEYVAGLSYDEDGEASYFCLDCVMIELQDALES